MGKYLEIKWYGRVGQGVLSAATLIAEVLVKEGKYVQAGPDFYNRRSCVSVQAYNRISDNPLKLHSAVQCADIVVIMDIFLFLKEHSDNKTYSKENTIFIINTTASPTLIKEKLNIPNNPVYTLDADSIGCCETSLENSIPNVALMTVLIYCMPWISMDSFKEGLQNSLSNWISPEQIEENLSSVEIVYQGLKEAEQETEKNPE